MEPVTDQYLKKTKYFAKWLLIIGLGTSTLILFLVFGMWLYAKFQGPPPLSVPQTTVFYSRQNKVIGESDYQHKIRYWVKLDDIAKPLQMATIAIEDKRFYSHHGFDIRRMIAAAFADLKSFSKVQGASTITMQYARNLFLSNDKTWQRKLEEAYYTMRLETNYSKNSILEGYLNTIYYGHGVYGIEAASRYYFGIDAKNLTLAEASMLAGIPKGPTYYSPIDNYQRAKHRQKLILSEMVKSHMVSQSDANKAYSKKLYFIKTHPKQTKIAPYFQDAVTRILKDKLHMSARKVALGGFRIYTTLDVSMQKEAEKWVHDIIQPASKIQAALVAMDPQTGEVKAMIGGRDYHKSSYNRAMQAKRTPGSSFKPFLYYAALKDGFTASTLLKSEPTTFTYNHGKSTYSPSNYGGYYANGPITLAQALALSDNIYAVKTNLFIGPETLVETAHKMGITSKLSPIPSLALGTMPVSVLEMTRGYSTIANGGYRVNPIFINKIVDHNGKIIYQSKPERNKVLESNYAFVLAHLMTGIFDEKLDNYARVTGASVSSILTHTVAGKSGTTTSDSWMLGFTPHLVAGVWVGYDKGTAISTYPDERYSKKIWAHFMEDALKGQPKNAFHPPKGVVGAMINPDSGLLASNHCPKSRWTYFVSGTQPITYCKATNENRTPKKSKPLPKPAKKKQGLFQKLWNWL